MLPFSTTRVFDEFNTGDTIEFQYSFGVEVYTGLEGGGHALYGDPFGAGGGGNQRFFTIAALVAPTGAVPEPASWALLWGSRAWCWRGDGVPGAGLDGSARGLGLGRVSGARP